jgi:hypothetical protein
MLKVGDKVTTEVYSNCKGAVYTITNIYLDGEDDRIFLVDAKPDTCKECGQAKGPMLEKIGSGWFKRYKAVE